MTPHKNVHSAYQNTIQFLLHDLAPQGTTAPEFAIETPDGIKVADVVWMTTERRRRMSATDPTRIAPEICIEVTSASDTIEEIADKIRLYFAVGAIEVWVCRSGAMSFYTEADHAQAQSSLIAAFPPLISVD
jgi:Uma2 family endonuclease